MKPIPVGYFRHHADSGWQQTSYRDLDEWRADLKNYADCDRDDTPPIPLYRYSELFDAAYGTPCQQVAWQQELERLRAEVERTHDDASALISRNAELRERATIAEAEVEALRVDAERYRWLRTYGWDICSLQCAVLDAAIDAARKEK